MWSHSVLYINLSEVVGLYEWSDVCSQSTSRIVSRVCTPDFRHTGSPWLKRIKVGMDWTWWESASSRFLSTSIFTILILSPHFSESCVKMEDCVLHGPHQVAKKSTSTGRVSLMISEKLFIV